MRGKPAQGLPQSGQAVPLSAKGVLPGLQQRGLQLEKAVLKGLSCRPNQLGRMARSGSPDICSHVGNGQIELVPDAGHHRDGGIKNRPGHGFGVEGPQILKRAAAPDKHDDLGPGFQVGLFKGGHHIVRRSLALDKCGVDNDLPGPAPAGGKVQKVPQGSGARSANHCHLSRM